MARSGWRAQGPRRHKDHGGGEWGGRGFQCGAGRGAHGEGGGKLMDKEGGLKESPDNEAGTASRV